jgi:sigma-54 dependent transcriptional regulator, acetoin dehydrogenase operon transcriptional activator AcoR
MTAAFPKAVMERLRNDWLRERTPAYIRIDRAGRLDALGGDCAHYGLERLQPGTPVEDQAEFLTGLLPVEEPLHIPLLQIRSNVYCDMHLFAGPDGDYVLLLDASHEAGTMMAVQQNAHEVALLKRRQEKMLVRIQSSYRDLLSIFDQLNLMVAVLGPDGTVEFLSEAAHATLGADCKAAVGRPWHSVLPFNDAGRDALRALLAAHPRGGATREVRTEGAQGTARVVDVEIRDVPQQPGKVILLLSDKSELYALRDLLSDKARFQDLIGKSRGMEQVFQLIRDVANVDATVLIQGETGTGKELVARAIHAVSPRRGGPFIVVNCAGLSDSLINSQLFGHRKGAFTDAVRDQVGLFEAANGGTILLDEIGDIPMNTQTRILRVLEEREVVRIGETEPRRIDIRILAATHRDLVHEVGRGTFREDLLYRIRVARIQVPALRERREDIPLLLDAFLRKARAATGKDVTAVSAEAMRVLTDYAWPGNVRELRNAVEFAVIRCRGEVMRPEDLPPELQEQRYAVSERETPDSASEKARILEALRAAGGKREEAARRLGISRATLYRRMKTLLSDGA